MLVTVVSLPTLFGLPSPLPLPKPRHPFASSLHPSFTILRFPPPCRRTSILLTLLTGRLPFLLLHHCRLPSLSPPSCKPLSLPPPLPSYHAATTSSSPALPLWNPIFSFLLRYHHLHQITNPHASKPHPPYHVADPPPILPTSPLSPPPSFKLPHPPLSSSPRCRPSLPHAYRIKQNRHSGRNT